MNKIEMTEEIMAAKKASAISWEALAEKVGISPVFLTSACLGMNSLKKEPADKVCEVLNLPTEVSTALQEFPHKSWDKAVPTDPVIYRFYEAIGVYGETMKEIIHEKFGDGIMSAIDFSMDIDKEENPQGDRVVITMNGKFLPYKSW
ncbi:cyanase [Pseudomonas sp. C27(2019)]|uniref:cyanase n=1 Tax=Pseudomonas sp. C27(2019) TaxID=2604941 RepID=UPI0012468275|nr:cyanase [Pseudomonas sp. C27(2019)]QEY59718.1 cyanase [Pseudomonas sp. C27(2019)]